MSHAIFTAPDLTTFTRLDVHGFVVVGQDLTSEGAVLECCRAEHGPWCRSCGVRATSLGSISRRLAHEPFGHRPTTLLLRIRRYHCHHCSARWREGMTTAAPERGKRSHGGIRWALKALVIEHLSVSRIAAGLGVAWHTANDAVLSEGRRVLIENETRFDRVRVIGVDDSPARCALKREVPPLCGATRGAATSSSP